MARPKKEGIDYFPHLVNSGKTIFILETKFGNDGYAFWFKLLELLGSRKGHYIDCNNVDDWMFLVAKSRINDISVTEILNTLSDLDAIDKELWQHKIIWSENLVNNVEDVYKKRGVLKPSKPYFCDENITTGEQKVQECGDFCDRNLMTIDISVTESTQSKVKESKEDKNKLIIEKEISETDIENVFEIYNTTCTNLSQVSDMTKARKKFVKNLLDKKDIETIKLVFAKANDTKFLTGENKDKWKANFDWLIDETNFAKVQERTI